MVRDYSRRRHRGEPMPERYEFRGIRKGGESIYVEVSVAAITYRGEHAALAYLRDVTERKRAEARLRESEEKYRSIFENALEGIFQRTPEGRLLAVNPALARMHGYASPEEMMTDVVDTSRKRLFVDREAGRRYRTLLEEHGFVRSFEAEQYRKDGSKFWLSFNSRVVKDADGHALYYEGIVEDITERKKLEDQLRQAQKMEAIGTLAGGVAHDFNNILTVISGFASLIQMNTKTDDPSRPFVDQVLASSEKAANLVQSLLAFGRKQRMQFQPHDLNDLVRTTGKLLRRLLPEDIELTLTLTDQKAVAVADVTQIDQVLMNLTTNARDAMPKGGSFTIETNIVSDASIETEEDVRPGQYVMLSASDTGVGMDETTARRIFDPFFTTKEVGKGTGLGLSSVYGIVKQHQGHITVTSSPNRGATFSVYLPLARMDEHDAVPSRDEIVRGGETILIAEDDSDVRKLTAQILQSYGYKTMQAADGEEAIGMFNANRDRVDLIILDVVMPRKNGKEVFDEIRGTRPDVKVLFVSGYTGDVMIDKGVESETVDFIPKPVSVNKLLRKVREVLDRRPAPGF
jgi:PAS domain S-box-containing protein